MIKFFKLKLLMITLIMVVSFFSRAQSISYGYGEFKNSSDISFQYITTGLLDQYTLPSPTAVTFSDDGTRMFVVFNAFISQFALETAFDVGSTITFEGDINLTEETAKADLTFSNDGTKMYVAGTNGSPDFIEQYSLSSAFDITSTVTHDGSFNVGSINPVTVSFNNTGTKMYVIRASGGPILNQYSITTPFDILSTVTLDGSVSLTDVSFAGGLVFNYDGSLMYVLDQTNNDVEIYSLSTPFDATTSLVNEDNYSVNANNTAPTGIDFSNDNKHFYVIGSNVDDVSQYEITTKAGFAEKSINDGSLDGSALVSLVGDTFVNAGGALAEGTHYTINNKPLGLSSTISVDGDGSNGILTFSGTADSHQQANNITDLEFTFEDAAFTTNSAGAVTNAVNALSALEIEFTNNAFLTYGFDFDIENGGGIVNGNPFSVASQDTNPTSIKFNTDGTKMFILGSANDMVYQYSLSNPFDVKTGVTYDGSPFDISSQETFPNGLAFSQDGMKMFVVGGINDAVNQYSLSSAFDITSGVTFDGSPYNVSAQEAAPTEILFNPNGTLMYIVGGVGDDVGQYGLSTPFDITSGVSFDGNYSVASQETSAESMFFSVDGTKMFVIGSIGDDINQYSLENPYDITSGVSFDGNSFNVSSQEFNPTGIAFNVKGDRMFVLGTSGDDINQYTVGAGDFLETAASNGLLDGSLTIRITGDIFTNASSALTHNTDYTINNLPTGLVPSLLVAADGLSAVLTLGGNASSHHNGRDISSIEFTFENSAFTNEDAAVVIDAVNAQSNIGIDFSGELSLTYGFEAFDLGAGVTFDDEFSFVNEEIRGTDLTFSNDGTKMFIIGSNGDEVNQYSLTNAFDVTSGVTFDGSPFSISSQETSPQSIEFSANGMKMFVLGDTGNDINQYSLSNSFDVTSGASFDGAFSILSEEAQPVGLSFSTDGTKMFVIGNTGDDVNQYNLSNAFDITSGASYSGTTYSIASQEIFPREVEFSNDGTKMFVIGYDGTDVNQYKLTTPFDLSTGVSFERSVNIGSEESSPEGLAFNAVGSKMYVLGLTSGLVHQYSINKEEFKENAANNGSIDGTLTIEISSDTFTNAGSNLSGSDYSISNLPSGLIPTIAVAADGISASLTISGNTSSHFDTDDIASLQFTFENSAFTNEDAIDILNAVATESNVGIDFFGTPSAPTDITIDNNAIDENEVSGTAVGSFTTTDVDAGETYTYTLVAGDGDADNGSFSIVGDQLQSAAMFDFETKNTYLVRINTNDGNGGNFEKEFIITITDVVEVITWSGTAWSNGSGPTDTDDVVINGDYSIDSDGVFDFNSLTINSGFTLTVDNESVLDVDGDLTNNGSLVVESGSSLLTYSANSFTGNDVEVRRNTRYAGGQYSFVGTPVMQNVNVTDGTIGSFVYYYDEFESYENDNGADRWKPMTGQLVPATGYTQANQQEIIFNGVPNTGTITHTGTFTDVGLEANKGWNLVANPYTAAINISDFFVTNTNNSGSVYIWDDNGSNTQRGSNDDYIVANGSMASSTILDPDKDRYNFHLGSAQAFFVKLDGLGNNNTIFSEGMRRGDKNADANFYRKTQLPIARINLTDDQGLFRQAVLGFAEDANKNELNKKYDAQAFNASADFGLFTMKAGRSLTLNGMTRDWETIQLQLNAKEAGSYAISVELEGYDQALYLRDNLTDEVADLRNGVYSFTTQSGIHTDRFELISSPYGVLNTELDEVKVFAFDKTLHIQQQRKGEQVYQLFNMEGRLLLSTRVELTKEIDLSHLSSGIYLVFDGQKTHKIILD